MNERLSCFLDGELSSHGEQQVLDRLRHDSELQGQWERYQLISDCLRNNLPVVAMRDLAGRVSDALKSEPVILAPRHRSVQFGKLAKRVAGVGVAATIATVAVLMVQSGPNNEVSQGNGQIAATVNDQASQPANVRRVAVRESSEVQAKLNPYLVNHNEYSVSTGVQGMMPYMRIVSYPAHEPAADETH